VLHLLFIYIFNSGASFLSNTAAGFPIYTATEGQNVSFEFPFTLVGGGRRFLCREECKNNNIIIETKSADAQNGSFNLRYRNGNLQVTIRELKMSDSGRYRCGVAGSSLSEVYEEIFEIRVTEGLNKSLCGAKTLIQTKGGSITVKCSFALSGRGKYVCRDPCENGDVLIETEATEAQNGRYSISYREGTFPASSTVLYVNISQLIQSDSGRYWCGLKRRLMIDSRQEFIVNVTDGSTSRRQSSSSSNNNRRRRRTEVDQHPGFCLNWRSKETDCIDSDLQRSFLQDAAGIMQLIDLLLVATGLYQLCSTEYSELKPHSCKQ
uniref:Immunoglobulin domain-containing protein n=1 Tax=Poecilia formosa TaxID=48698 RepID=A0A096M6P5_POEFO